MVNDPNTSFVSAEYLGATESRAMKSRLTIFGWRFLKATYCYDGESVLGHFEGKESSSWAVTAVRASQLHQGWVEVHYNSNIEDPEQPEMSASGTGTVVFSPADDWAVRELRFATGAPYNLQGHLEIPELLRLPAGGILAKALTLVFYRPIGSSGQEHNADDESWSEKIEYELVEADQSATPASEFTLAALGIGSRSFWRSLWLLNLVWLIPVFMLLGLLCWYVANKRSRLA